jgi:hypothetical protein
LFIYLLQSVHLVLRYPYEGGEQKRKPERERTNLSKRTWKQKTDVEKKNLKEKGQTLQRRMAGKEKKDLLKERAWKRRIT